MIRKAHVKVQAAEQSMKLRQMGAKVVEVKSKLFFITFQVGHIEVEYVYNLNHHNMFFLERVKPYPEPHGTFTSEKAVIKQIKTDLDQFKNAEKSKNIDEFIEINRKLNHTIQLFEELYLYYNVPKDIADNILEKIIEIDDIVHETYKNADRVYFKNEPKLLKEECE